MFTSSADENPRLSIQRRSRHRWISVVPAEQASTPSASSTRALLPTLCHRSDEIPAEFYVAQIQGSRRALDP
ncbi:hypothetical protein AALP_AAs74022U000100 [Arabis alpina]|uniref:Uncharacterized protein n=1 Tax=Arabis alpina TaxID=50452 RepID=A0A087FWZ5_ARAAL|nr:hypothetical protein AALP_AAs74022U000100 [Arabis alpina]